MKRILIVGAGYGGMACAVNLQKRQIPFQLINKHSYHYFTTLLHEAAGGRNDFTDYYVPITDILSTAEAEIIKDEVTAILPKENRVETRTGKYDYDLLVIGLGNAPEFFGIPGLADHSLLLRSLESAKTIHSHIEEQVAGYQDDPDPARLKIVVGGAGLTGIELCGELIEWLPRLAASLGIKDQIELIDLEAAPAILPMLDQSLQDEARRVLTEKGVQLRTGEKIVKVEKDLVELASGEKIESRTIIWTGGVRANPLIKEAGFECDPRGRAQVNSFFQPNGYENVFVLGDSACLIGKEGKPLPPTAQLAGQMGEHCAKNLQELIQGRPLETFTFHYMGTLASLGSEVGVGSVKGLKTKGVPAGLLKEASKAKYLFQLGGFRLMASKSGQFARNH